MSGEPHITTEEILSPDKIDEAVAGLARDISSRCRDPEGPPRTAFVGIYTRGVTLARRVAGKLSDSREAQAERDPAGKGADTIPIGTLDISLYRDDFDNRGNDFPKLESSDVPFALDGARVILFDEVIFTGRTIRAALDGLMDYGRPAKIELAVLVDRGHRELPIQPDYTGHTVETTLKQYVKVRFREDDGKEGVHLITEQP